MYLPVLLCCLLSMMTFSVCGMFPTFNTLETVTRKKTKMIISLGFSLAIFVINGGLSEGNELYFINVRFPFCYDEKIGTKSSHWRPCVKQSYIATESLYIVLWVHLSKATLACSKAGI